MSSDLIFHIVSRRKWHTLAQDGYYTPEGFEENDKIECVGATDLKDYLNEFYKTRKNLLLLVIDKYRLVHPLTKKENGKVLYYVEGGINVDSILDKIRIDCGKDGQFDIDIEID